MKILRLDKIAKIKEDLIKNLTEKGMQNSYLRFAVEFMTL